MKRFLVAMGLAAAGCGSSAVDPLAAPAWQPAFDPGAAGALLSVWGPDERSVWAVGGQPDAGAAFRFDGRAWAPVPGLPAGPGLSWAHGAGRTVWFVGEGGRALRLRDARVEATPTGVGATLWGVWAAGDDEAWAVGGDAVGRGPADPVLLRWDGEAWRRVPVPPLDREVRALFKVWGTGPDDVFAVGAGGVILHWDGRAWSPQESGVDDDLVSLWGRGDHDIVAVGGRARGLAVRWDGRAWTPLAIGGVPGLNGVWMDADGTAWAVGVRGTVVRIAADGSAPERERPGTVLMLHGTFGFPGGRRYAVGGSLGGSPPYEGVALVYEARPE
jgi:hypothetical protein